MTDLTRLLASLKRRAAHAKEFGHDVLFVKIEDIDALVEALESSSSSSDSQGRPGKKDALLAISALKHP
ncbi:TPA: hypothetical protein N3442_000125 [Klebsiella aerogenes]|nr:hypothetical protein [Klebsiella aerogenes]HCM7678826.1 hypothetical protein [Klebsiella aerogenes]HCM8002500.1 hypothetical protein [Klebsiella aerogenes]